MNEWELVTKYLDRKLSGEEESEFSLWLNADEKNQQYFKNIEQIWKIPDKPLPLPDVEKAYQNVKYKSGIIDPDTKQSLKPTLRKTIIYKYNSLLGSRIIQAAAIMIIISLISFILYQPASPAKMIELIVANAERKDLVLPDGTQIILDAGSIMTYPEKFNTDERKVYLNGEAYFQVETNPDQPFIIETNDALITVLGTKFNIRSWQEEEQITVAVAHGKVSLTCLNNNEPVSKVTLRTNQVSYMAKGGNPSAPQYADIESFLSWQQREKYFKSVPLVTVLDQLQRWYDVEFHLPNDKSGNQPINIFIENKPIENIIEVIALINNYDYEIQGKRIIFSQTTK